MAMTRRKQPKNLKKLDVPNFGIRTSFEAAGRHIKMFFPRCPSYEWQTRGSGVTEIRFLAPAPDNCQLVYRHPHWWQWCNHKVDDGTNLYWTTTDTELDVPVIDVREDGKRIRTGTEVQLITSTVPNITGVPFSNPRINSGKSMGNAIDRGYKHLRELGYRDACEYANCFSQTDLIQTSYGQYCTVEQARLVAAEVEGIPIEALDARRRSFQLRELPLDLTDQVEVVDSAE